MSNEPSFKDIYEAVSGLRTEVNTKFSELSIRVEKYHDVFRKFEEGKVSDLIQRVTTLEENRRSNEDSLLKKLGYKVVEYIILGVLGAILYLVLK